MLLGHRVVLREYQETSMCQNLRFSWRTKSILVANRHCTIASSTGCRRADMAEGHQAGCLEGKR